MTRRRDSESVQFAPYPIKWNHKTEIETSNYCTASLNIKLSSCHEKHDILRVITLLYVDLNHLMPTVAG